jgi:2-phospho-L-lactate guanylyltransferase (CobY/MobA/RfbA family)
MNSLLIPVSPLTTAKSRLKSVFSEEKLKSFTISLFKDFALKVSMVKAFENKLVYCTSPEILELAEEFGLTPIKEDKSNSNKTFDEVIEVFNDIAMKKYEATKTTLAFCDVILINRINFIEISSLLKNNQLVICPAVHSGGISILGRSPPNIIPTFFSHPSIPSLFAMMNEAKIKKLKFVIYDSFRSGFDIDIKHDLVLAYEYLKALNMKDTNTYKFLKDNLKLTLLKKILNDNRELEIKEIDSQLE